MPTTTIRLPDELKARIARLAERSGMTPHSFILEAIAEKTAQEEQRVDFHETAERRYAQLLASGQSIPWDELRGYLEKRLDGEAPPRPAARKLAP
jgi:predicted transcriptional regulator